MLFSNGARIEKGKSNYSFLSNLCYHYRNLRKWEPMTFWMGFIVLIPWIIVDLAGNYLPSIIVEGLEAGWELESLLVKVGVFIIVLMLAQIINGVINI